VVSVTTLRSTAFQDEALYLYAGRVIIHNWGGGPVPLEHFAFYFSGYPDVYPVVGGFLDMIGGLELARDFSLICMLGVTAIVYAVTRKLWGQPAAIFAAAAYASAGVVLFVGRLATFDAMCLFLIALAAQIAFHGGTSKRPWAATAIGPVLVLAILAKYAALLFVPPVFGLVACLSVTFLGWRAGWRHGLVRLALALLSFFLSLGIAYEVINKEALHALQGSTTSRIAILKEPRLTLFTHVLQMGGLVFLVGFLGMLLVLRYQRRFAVVAVLLFGSSCLAPAYHIYEQEFISLDKHIAYALFFAAPLAGYALTWLSGIGRRPFFSPYRGYWVAGLAVVLALFTLGLSQARTLYASWANTSTLSSALHTQLRDGTGRILAEDIEVARFDAMDVTQEWQWNGVRFAYYMNARHQQFLGNAALAQGIKDRYYNWVELSFVYLPAQAYYAAGQMMATRNYDLITAIPFCNSFGKGHFYLFRSAPLAGHGNFTSWKQLKTKHWSC
jgi:4-amino-4-deoxy-L-arabinose transferase-like glycosyltransferase